ncbi:MAG TPA: hypothetical protein VFF55_10995 [Candidatus Deferrimicrobium sp.]|nr:hypothetical protein [Candidatus Deferrimicrobium sp.]
MDIPAPRPHVVIIGGFLTEPLFFRPMRERLLQHGAARVSVARLHWPDWLAMGMVGMGPVMLRGARAIRQARRAAPDAVIVVGHSAGGLIARLAMSPEPIDGRYAGVARDVGCLVTLGTPNRFDPVIPGWRHAGVRAAEFLERVTPGAWFAPQTAYVSVGSRLVPPSPIRPSLSFGALGHVVTRVAVGQAPGARGDGLVDEERSRLPGARHLAFDDVLHGTFGGPWYGDAHVIDRWWPLALEAWRGALDARQHAHPGVAAGQP